MSAPGSGSARALERAREEDFHREVQASLPRNYAAHLAHGLLGQTGFRLIHAPTFVPDYLFALSGSELAVGLGRALQSLGMFLSPVLGAAVIEHRRRVLPVGFLVGGLMRVQLLGIGLAGLLLPAREALVATWLFLLLFGFFLGIQGVVFSFLVSKVIPVGRRGMLLGIRNALSGVTAAAVGTLGGVLVAREVLGSGHAATFLLAFALTTVGLGMLLFVREPAAPTVRRSSPLLPRLRELPALLRGDPGYRRYVLGRALGTAGRMAMPFYILHAATRIEIGGRELGLLTAAFVLAQSVGNLFWGLAADRRGFRFTIALALAVWIGAGFLLLAGRGFGPVFAAYLGLGAGVGGFQMSAQNLVLEFGARPDLPMRIAVASSVAELAGALAPLAGGVLATASGYPAAIVAAAGCQILGLLTILLGVDEPRRRPVRG